MIGGTRNLVKDNHVMNMIIYGDMIWENFNRGHYFGVLVLN